MSDQDPRRWVTINIKVPHEVAVQYEDACELAQITGKARSSVEQFEAIVVTAQTEWLSEAEQMTHSPVIRDREAYAEYLFRQTVRERDGFRCVLCQSTKVDVAHIVPRSADSTRKLDPLNAVAMCRPCHELTGVRWKDYVESLSAIAVENTSAPKWRFEGEF